MRAFKLFIVLLLAPILFTGCNTNKVKPLPTATQTTVITTSPVTGKELDKTKDQLELDGRLLADCVVPMPAPSKTAKTVLDASALKAAEIAIYYDCAYRHNALVEFLSTRLGIKPVSPIPEAKPSNAVKPTK